MLLVNTLQVQVLILWRMGSCFHDHEQSNLSQSCRYRYGRHDDYFTTL